MSFIVFFIYYIFSTLILFAIIFILYKLFFKKLISSKISEIALLSAFDSLDKKSILDINTEDIIDEEEKKDEKIYTYF